MTNRIFDNSKQFSNMLKKLNPLTKSRQTQSNHRLAISLNKYSCGVYLCQGIVLIDLNYTAIMYTRDGRYQNFDVDAISICKASIYQYITIFITVWTFSLNLCKCIKYTAFCFKFLCFGDLNLPLLLKTATLWTLSLPWLTSNPKINLFAIYIF